MGHSYSAPPEHKSVTAAAVNHATIAASKGGFGFAARDAAGHTQSQIWTPETY